MQDSKKIFFLCDGEVPECKKTMCFKNNKNDPCRWTSDIKHAKNFKDHGGNGTYFEVEQVEAFRARAGGGDYRDGRRIYQ